MRKINVLIVLLGVVSLCVSAAAIAQPGMKWKGSGGWGPGGQYSRMYDQATVETISGVVETIGKIPSPGRRMTHGLHVTVKTATGTISVHLGPAWYIERLDTEIKRGDRLEVKGSRITYRGKPAIIAAEIRKGDAVLLLRDKTGFPAWAGWRRRQ
ncbi:MAG TPA: DNA-binding protein [Nitrospiraceae bacterium]|nr:DNA-binding protein [Nitrospiraceae bacterium]